jgi:hypothetical protein
VEHLDELGPVAPLVTFHLPNRPSEVRRKAVGVSSIGQGCRRFSCVRPLESAYQIHPQSGGSHHFLQ